MKVLIIRFSSFGDVLQTLSVAGRLGDSLPHAEIHWVTRQEFLPLIHEHPHVKKVWCLERRAGLADLLRLGRELRAEKFTHIYDAHNNLRSRVLGWQLKGFLSWRGWLTGQKFLRRSIYRWRRFLLFRLHKNLFPKPFSGQFALLEPLQAWGLPVESPRPPQLFLSRSGWESARAALADFSSEFIALAPSAAFPLKRWPVEYWQELVRRLPGERFVVLGGPEDLFLGDLEKADPLRVRNLAGRLTLEESAHIVAHAKALVANDTGLMHVAEQVGRPCVALMGPAPFGFPSRPLTKVMQLDLSCRPCSKHGQGPCVNPEYHKCLRGISPFQVAQELKVLIHA
jgi:lipopolysaccharide heptosyltransferase II